MYFPYPSNTRYDINWFLYSLINSHLNDMLHRYSRVLGVRIDLFYIKSTSRFRQSTYRTIESDVRKLMTKTESCSFVTGYFWVIERTPDHGFHAHVIFYLDGHHTQKPFPLVQRVSEFWRDITNAEGYYDWSNYKKNYQADINRKINHSDIKSINELRYIISYLAKEEQKNGMYIWGSNEVPPPSGLGRPRNSDSL